MKILDRLGQAQTIVPVSTAQRLSIHADPKTSVSPYRVNLLMGLPYVRTTSQTASNSLQGPKTLEHHAYPAVLATTTQCLPFLDPGIHHAHRYVTKIHMESVAKEHCDCFVHN